ncbi:MAG: 5-formyltetrahydrofolate cyclo-ligase, partial [Cyclobacteriaceae bacterium]|nr:5-formyltetrahydrofolate cyclo-ligase [Cyclobacteriaceae bacterium]
MIKQELREQYLARRFDLTEPEYDVLNVGLAEQFFRHINLQTAKVIHVFLPMLDRREPNTWKIIETIKAEHPHVTLVVPRMKGDMLEHLVYEGHEQLVKGKWNVPEPKGGLPVPVSALDIVLVPMLICDVAGNRVGYGKGYYDRFLVGCRKNTLKIGVTHFKPVQ